MKHALISILGLAGCVLCAILATKILFLFFVILGTVGLLVFFIYGDKAGFFKKPQNKDKSVSKIVEEALKK